MGLPDVKANLNLTVQQKDGQEVVVKHEEKAVKTLKTTIPFVKNHNLDYSKIMGFCGKYKVAARLDTLRNHDHLCRYCRLQRCQSQ